MQANKNIEDSYQSVARNVKKRSRSCLQEVEKCTGPLRKKTAVEKEGFRHGVFGCNPMLEKVDAVPPSQTLLGERNRRNSLINIDRGIFEAIQVVQRENADSEHYLRLMQERTDAESVSSSVGSCGANKSPYRSTGHHFNDSGQYMESHNDFLQASAALGREASFPTKEALHQAIHSLELHAYRSTMAAFFASGPINWEQEALLTNLRQMLHISIDEHLMELKNLANLDK
ncbi:uncharacterized protein LOC110031502 [Phalaenopsis equestris]|uniref:uncharacterized protein LOC110031502 n=1 Tax=Phalaenopsis equestris TaxID=78828 RepID=UPI0009E5E37D|nr:uncharacterized protein LOC110031502 [Phalaenopsis equestris]